MPRSGNLALLAVAIVLVVGVAGWLGAMPRGGEVATVPVPALAPGAYVDAGGTVVEPTPTSAPADPKPATPSSSSPPSGMATIVIQSQWLSATATQTGIPPRVLHAYAAAAVVTDGADPGCRIAWNTIAAIGDIESANGTSHDAHIDASGELVGSILGPPLNGTKGDAALPNTDPALDGGGAWARAVGPMQFLPSTWAVDGADGNGDGHADPNNIDDAALATARYLCADGRDLSTPAGWSAAILSYNHDSAYESKVRAQANTYAADTR